jgi:hypothetical protein
MSAAPFGELTSNDARHTAYIQDASRRALRTGRSVAVRRHSNGPLLGAPTARESRLLLGDPAPIDGKHLLT